MKKYLVTSVLLVVALSLITIAAAAQKRSSQRRTPAAVPPPNAINRIVLPEATLPVLTIESATRTPKEHRPLHKALTEKMTPPLQTVPDHRLTHFKWLLNRDDFTIRGWKGYIEDAQAVPNGYVVTLRVGPIVKSTHGAITLVHDTMLEKYLVTDSGVQLLEAVSPPGSGVENWSIQ
jgi:hypothetical protein